MTAPSPYFTLPAEGPVETALGSAFLTLVEPHLGHEEAYNRWYEDDHYYAGALTMPWWFSARRWVATRPLRDLRYPADSPILQPVDTGCYFGTYWITAGRFDDQWQWLRGTGARLITEGRIFSEHTHVSTGYYDFAGSSRRDADGPRDFQALDYPFAGLVLEIVDTVKPHTRDELRDRLLEAHVPAVLADSPVAMCLAFTPHPPPRDVWWNYAQQSNARVVLLWFTDVDPRECWNDSFAGEGEALTAAGLGRAQLVAPFIPTLPGTNRYVDELR